MKNRNSKIFVFGDSHALFWDGTELPDTKKLYSDVDVWHQGPILAWNAREKALSEIWCLVDGPEGLPDYIFLSFGEIDVRTGRPRQEECALRLFNVAKTLANDFDTEVVIITPPPPSDEGAEDPEYPRVGELPRREFRTSRFVAAIDTYVSSASLKGSAKISAVHPSILLREHDGIYSDGRHLNRKALAEILKIETRFQKYFINKVS